MLYCCADLLLVEGRLVSDVRFCWVGDRGVGRRRNRRRMSCFFPRNLHTPRVLHVFAVFSSLGSFARPPYSRRDVIQGSTPWPF